MSTHPFKQIKSNCHLFHVGYDDGRDKWIAFNKRNLSDLTVFAMKEKIAKSEKGRASLSREKPTIWYVGKLALWK